MGRCLLPHLLRLDEYLQFPCHLLLIRESERQLLWHCATRIPLLEEGGGQEQYACHGQSINMLRLKHVLSFQFHFSSLTETIFSRDDKV